MMKRYSITLIVCVMLNLFAGRAQSSNLSCILSLSQHCSAALLDGPINDGDYPKVLALLRTNYPDLGSFYLNSSGGNLTEALQIGRLFRKYLISTTAPTRQQDGTALFILPGRNKCLGYNCGVCASACALIWFGGVDRNGTVGLHRPRTDDPSFSGLSPAEASIIYRRVLGEIDTYLAEMEVPKSIIETMISTGSSEIHWVDSIDDSLDQSPSIAEWSAATCPGQTPEAMTRKFGETFTPEGRAEAQGKATCDLLLYDTHRTKLAPP
jgi:hypothetical protein